MKPENVLHLFVEAFVGEIARSGLRHVCVCPGSRSTPLAMLLDRHPDVRVWMHLDERSAAFFALGMARERREPVAVLCTSGTAAANFLPAVVEAHYAGVPLLVFTADRPHELRDVGAPQAIDQLRLYGAHAKWFVDVALPEASPDALRSVRTLACRAVATARATPPGPVHLNFPFREPLTPVPELATEGPAYTARGRGGRIEGHFDGGRDLHTASHETALPSPAHGKGAGGEGPGVRGARITISDSLRIPDPAVIQSLAADLNDTDRGLIICGPQDDPDLPPVVMRLARTLGYPILADPLSQVRCGPHSRLPIVDAYDAFLRDERCVASLEPQVVLRFGAMSTSKQVFLYLQRHLGCRQIVVASAPLAGYGGGWNDPGHTASDIVSADPLLLCAALVDHLADRMPDDTSWQERWLRIGSVTRRTIADHLSCLEEPFEGKVFAELAGVLPDGALLYVGNSMPVRDLDTFFPAIERPIRFLANRGANGIDGVVSSALGASATSPGPLVLVIGDLSFYHDLNGLLAARQHHLDATIILLNNDGGGIFSFLPQAAHQTGEDASDQFETLFGTPHGLDFRPVVEMYGGRFERVATWPAFRRALESIGSRGLQVIEMPTERNRNVTLHRGVWRAVAEALQDDGADSPLTPLRALRRGRG